MKPDGYYSEARPEMLEMVPSGVTNILEIGCGAGIFGAQCRQRFGARVTGIEVNPACREAALGNLDSVLTGDAAMLIPTLPDASFDLLVCNDVLEHLPDPEAFLRTALPKLCTGGHLLVSIPNFRYAGNLWELLIEKDLRYRDSGILDKTHLRFFTKKSIRRMLENAGLEIVRLEGINYGNTIKKIVLAPLFWLTGGTDLMHPQFGVLVRKVHPSSS